MGYILCIARETLWRLEINLMVEILGRLLYLQFQLLRVCLVCL